jgi:hypothetical protein
MLESRLDLKLGQHYLPSINASLNLLGEQEVVARGRSHIEATCFIHLGVSGILKLHLWEGHACSLTKKIGYCHGKITCFLGARLDPLSGLCTIPPRNDSNFSIL